MAPFFSDPIELIEDEEDEDLSDEVKDLSLEEKEQLKKKLDEDRKIIMEKLQAEASEKQKERNAIMGELLRSKGFLWMATTNDVIGAWQQAGNVLRIRGENQWMCLTPQFWEGSDAEALVRQVSLSASEASYVFLTIRFLESFLT